MLGLNQYYTQKALNNLSAFTQMQALGLNQNYIQFALDKPVEFSQIQTLKLKQNDIEKALDNLGQFTQNYQNLSKLRKIYDTIFDNIELNQVQAHGIGGGNAIAFKGGLKTVPKGVSKIWSEITDERGNFKLMDNVGSALQKSKTQAEAGQGYRGATLVGIFFGSYRDSRTKALYNEISQALS
ncbi:hypothetical protein AB894_00615 [Piscirickettsia salmonis]|nr:hypothetical protein AB894_00615 [Piscirickettsia salmonis]